MAQIINKEDMELMNIAKDIDNVVTDTQKERISITDDIVRGYLIDKYPNIFEADINYKILCLRSILADGINNKPIILNVPSFKGKNGFVYRDKDITLEACSKISVDLLDILLKQYGALPNNYEWYWKNKGFETRFNEKLSLKDKLKFFLDVVNRLADNIKTNSNEYESLDLAYTLVAISLM